MEAITEYIKRNSNGRKRPVRGATIASAFGVSGVRVRNMVNSAREIPSVLMGTVTTLRVISLSWKIPSPLSKGVSV